METQRRNAHEAASRAKTTAEVVVLAMTGAVVEEIDAHGRAALQPAEGWL